MHAVPRSRQIFVWLYGASCGGYSYVFKTWLFSKVRARNFARAWSFAQLASSAPNLIGIPAASKIYSLRPIAHDVAR